VLGWSGPLGGAAAGPSWLASSALLEVVHLGAVVTRAPWLGALPTGVPVAYYLALGTWLALTGATARAWRPSLARRLGSHFALFGSIAALLALLATLTWPYRSDGRLHLLFLPDSSLLARLPDGHRALLNASASTLGQGGLADHLGFWDRTIDLLVQ